MSHWRPADMPNRARPTFQPIVRPEPLTDEERLALSRHPALERYPSGDWLTAKEREVLHYWRWWWTRRGYDR